MEAKLTDCYTMSEGKALMSGTEALVRLLLEQSRIDRLNGLKTEGLVSGYPGSPLGGLDIALGKAKAFLDEEGVHFQPAVNEELAATALWGSQHIDLYDNPDIQGVFSMWYGKGPGLDRAMDALRHANQGGVAPHGGMVIAVGDDPTGKSSTLAYQSDQNFHSLGIPYFFPKNVSDIISMGLEAFALSRYSGCCVGLKIVVDVADSNAVVDMSKLRPSLPILKSNNLVHVTKHDPAGLRESKLHEVRLPAVQTWCKQSDNVAQIYLPVKKGKTRLGIIGVGKIAIEVNEALGILLPGSGEKNKIAFITLSSESSPNAGNKFTPSGVVFPESKILRPCFTLNFATCSSTKERFSSITKTSSTTANISNNFCSGSGQGIFKAVNAILFFSPLPGKRMPNASLTSLAIFPTPIIPSRVFPFFTGK